MRAPSDYEKAVINQRRTAEQQNIQNLTDNFPDGSRIFSANANDTKKGGFYSPADHMFSSHLNSQE
jgi:hypothetical protein